MDFEVPIIISFKKFIVRSIKLFRVESAFVHSCFILLQKKGQRSDKIRANIKSTFSGGEGELFQPNRVDVSILMKF